MSSLQEQLLKAGLANKQQAKNIKAEKRKAAKKKRKSGDKPTQGELEQSIQQAAETKKQKDAELNAQQKLQQEQKEKQARLKQLIESNTEKNVKGEITFNFTFDNKVKSINVTNKIKDQLTVGTLAIVMMDDNPHIINADAAMTINNDYPEVVGYLITTKEEKPDEDDPYADYEVPDDLMW